VKLAIVGAGSTYTPEVIDGLVRLRGLVVVDDVALCEVDESRLDVVLIQIRVGGQAARMVDESFDPSWPVSIVHECTDAEIWVDEEAMG
jgi:alpha-galactosidase/6-phospho-beta-glucosidase family protein